MALDKIIYVSDGPLPSEKANSVNVVKMCESFASIGKSVTLIIPQIDSKYEYQDVKDFYGLKTDFDLIQIRIPRVKGALIIFAFKVLYWFLSNNIKKDQACFIYGRSVYSLGILGLFKFNLGIDVHGKYWERGLFRKLSFLAISTSAKTKIISFNTNNLLQEFKKRFSHSKTKLVALQNGASVVNELQTFNLIGKNNLAIGYIGSFNAGRGIEVIIALVEVLPDIDFHLAGNHEKYVDKEMLENKYENIHFYGHISFKDTFSFRAACDILVAPYQANVSVSSGERTVNYMSPIKIFEYMSAQKAIIASKLPAIEEIINKNECFLVTCDDIDEWTDAITKLRDKNLRKNLGLNAYLKFKQKYTWEKRAQHVIEIVEES